MKAGQPTRRLEELARKNRLPHALLMAGSDAALLRAEAMALALYLLCESGGPARPCCSCSACRRLASNAHPDLRLVAPEAKEVKIEQVRELQRWLYLAPFEAPVKVGIVDPAEALNAASANSLLKILEEPPPHAYIVLLGRSPEGLLPTVLSRLSIVRYPGLELPPDPSDAPAWESELDAVFAGRPMEPNRIFDLTAEIGRAPENLRRFFSRVEGRLRDELARGPASGVRTPGPGRLDALFDLALEVERETLQRYGNTALGLDRLLTEIHAVFRG